MTWLKSIFKVKPPIDELIGSWTTSGFMFFKRDIHHLLCFQTERKGYYQIIDYVNCVDTTKTTDFEWKRINNTTVWLRKIDGLDEATIKYNMIPSHDEPMKQLKLYDNNYALGKSKRMSFWIIAEVLYKGI
nr:hypothetical protein [uncultured Psychroserpens sp.]